MTKPNDSAATPTLPGGKLAYSPNGLADATDTGRSKIFEEMRAGRLKYRKLGKRTIILQSDALEWLNGLPPASAKPAA